MFLGRNNWLYRKTLVQKIIQKSHKYYYLL